MRYSTQSICAAQSAHRHISPTRRFPRRLHAASSRSARCSKHGVQLWDHALVLDHASVSLMAEAGSLHSSDSETRLSQLQGTIQGQLSRTFEQPDELEPRVICAKLQLPTPASELQGGTYGILSLSASWSQVLQSTPDMEFLKDADTTLSTVIGEFEVRVPEGCVGACRSWRRSDGHQYTP